ncbi:MAG: hypothetical protein FJ096_10220 [Deltaproteobacteria bacterium]|nr:hypothetical protein [Deltaproteobacteria bacterium]
MNATRLAPKACFPLLVATGLALGGCSEVLESPSLTAGDVTPDLFCGDEIPGTISITGKGFAPLPTKTLEGKTQLVLPKVELLAAASFEGGDPATASFVVPDDAAFPGSSALTFVSESELTFKLAKGNLSPGVYDVRVTNPSGLATATWPAALAIVPPPVLEGFDSAKNALACLAEGDQSRTITGKWFARVDDASPTVTIGDKTFEVTAMDGCQPVIASVAQKVELCTSITYTMPKDSLAPGFYSLSVKNPDPVGCAADTTLPVAVVAPPTLLEVVPSAVCADGEPKTVTVEGEGFIAIDGTAPTVLVGGMTVMLAGAPMDCAALGTDFPGVQVCAQLVATLPAASAPGEYDVVVKNPAPVDCSTAMPASISVAPIPTVASVEPVKLCSGGGKVTVKGTGFWVDGKMNAPVVTFTPQGGGTVIPAAVVTCTDCDPANAMAGTTLEAQVGAGLVPGTVYDVSVTNPGDCAATGTLPTVTVEVGPVLYLADPFVVPNAINTRVTLYTTKLVEPLPDPVAWIVPTGQMMPTIPLAAAPIDPAFPKRLQVTVPKGTAAGVYDVYLDDGIACPATMLKEGLTVTEKEDLALASLTPAFGATAASTPITIFRDGVKSKADFLATPRVYLNPAKSTSPPDDAKSILLASTSFVDKSTLTAVVPAGTPAGLYDVIVVNPTPTAEVGVLLDGFAAVVDPPPVVTTVVPPSITAQSGQQVEVVGDAFRTGAVITASCVDTMKQPVMAPAVTNTAPTCASPGKGCKMTATINGGTLAQGYVCLLKVTNTDKTFGEFSAIGVTNASLNIETPKAGSNMLVKRRGLGSAAAKPTTAARFLYAIAGDTGMDAASRSDVEFVSVDLFGTMGATWKIQRNALLQKRAFFGTAQTDRYVYVVGGTSNGDANALASAERAQILDPLEAPAITDVDFAYDQLGATGLASGEWIYRVAAEFDATDLHNPGGEGLPSDPLIVKIPLGAKLGVAIFWKAPVDCLGQPLPNVVKYHVYRTPLATSGSGNEKHLAEVPASQTSYADNGGTPNPMHKPLPLGSTGKWTLLPGLGANNERSGVSAVIGVDPTTPDTKRYLYALFGRNKAGTDLKNYQHLPITRDACGHETVGATWTTGTNEALVGRKRAMSWLVDRSVRADVGANTNLIYVGGGQRKVGASDAQEVSVVRTRIGTNGALDPFVAVDSLKSGGVTGGGVLAAANQLFVLGGEQGANLSIQAKGVSAPLTNAAGDLASNSWNAGLSLLSDRAHMGSSVQSAFAFFLGGQQSGMAATNTTEFVVW